MKSKMGAALLSVGAAAMMIGAPTVAVAAPPPPPIDFGSLFEGGPQGPQGPQNPGRPDARNGVASMSVSVTKRFGKQLGPDLYDTSFTPWVKWSARNRANAEVKGKNCQVEITFPGTTKPTYQSAACQGQVGVGDRFWKKPGRYSIVVVDRVSGARASQSFRIE